MSHQAAVEDAEAAADDRVRICLIREADARCEVRLLRIGQALIVGVLHGDIVLGQRAEERRAKVDVLRLGGKLVDARTGADAERTGHDEVRLLPADFLVRLVVVIANTQIQRQLRTDLPVILRVARVIPLRIDNVRRVCDVGVVRLACKKVGDIVSGIAVSGDAGVHALSVIRAAALGPK